MSRIHPVSGQYGDFISDGPIARYRLRAVIEYPIIIPWFRISQIQFVHPLFICVLETAEEFCTSLPQENVIDLPDGCTFYDESFIDIGQCEGNACYGGPNEECSAVRTHCCTPLTYETVYMTCDGDELPLEIVTSCGCGECPTSDDVTIIGIASGSDGTPLQNGSVYFNGSFVTNTSDDGQFEFDVPRATRRGSVLFVDDVTRYFMDNSYIFQLSSDTQDTYFIRVHLLPRGNTTTVNATEESFLEVGEAEVEIPPNAFYTQDGQLFTVS